MRTTATFSRETEGFTQHVSGHFASHPQLVNNARDLDTDQIVHELNLAVEQFNARESGFVLDVENFTVIITQYRPLTGSTFIPTPRRIAGKRAVINVHNFNDNRCFQWAVLSCLYPPKNNPLNVYSYMKYANTLNFDDISFPISLKDISKFEKQNPDISVNVISMDQNDKDFCVEYLSPERQRKHHVNLLLLDDSLTTHYVWIKDFSKLIADRTKHTGGGASFVCNSCLNVFTSQRVLDAHIPYCLQHAPQRVQYPDPDDCKLKFKDYDKQQPLNFYLVCDFESFLTPATDADDVHTDPDAKTHVVDHHNVSGFCCYRVTDLSQCQTPPKVYSGPDVMSHFYEHII